MHAAIYIAADVLFHFAVDINHLTVSHGVKACELLKIVFNINGCKEVITLQNLLWIIAMARMPQASIGVGCKKTGVSYGGIPCCKQHISASDVSGCRGREVGK